MDKVVVAGHVCLDITPIFPLREQQEIKEIMKPGSLINMEGVDIHTGGCAANTGIAMQFFGSDVEIMGKIGDDDFGRIILNILKQYGCRTDGMVIDSKSITSYSVVIAIPGNDRIFLHASGANNSFCCEDLDFDRIGQAKHFHFGYPPLMKKMYKQGGAEMIKLFKKVKSMGLTTSLDMAAIDPQSDAAKEDWMNILSDVLPYVDYFLPSIEEICFMIDRDMYDRWKQKGEDVTSFITVENEIKQLGRKVYKLGCKNAIIKCGPKGIYYINEEEEGFQPSFKPEKICSATGAGDTCIAAFLTAKLRGETFHKSVQIASAAGASCVSSYDAVSGLLRIEELKKRIENGWEIQEV